jgi:uncharacterized membrane protein
VSAADWFLLGLRIAHGLAAMLWLGGGVYFLLALRPALRDGDDRSRALVAAAQRAYGEWAQAATVVMLATGAVLSFDRLSSERGGLTYALLLAVKVASALAAFWLVGVRPGRRAASKRGSSRSRPELVAALGLTAFVLGVALSTVYGRGPA